MKDNHCLHLLKYWRNTLADAARVAIDVQKALSIPDASIDYQNGAVAPQQAEKLIADAEKRLNEKKGNEKQDWESIDRLQVLISPFYVTPLVESVKTSVEAGRSYPFWIRATLNRAGSLAIDEDTFPFIPRNYLEPQVNQDVNYTFSSVDKIDEVFSTRLSEDALWRDYWKYIETIFLDITGTKLVDYSVEGFAITRHNVIVANDTMPNAADGIIQLYDYLTTKQELPSGLNALCRRSYSDSKRLLSTNKLEIQSAAHRGQMGYEYPLSISQRKSLYHFTTQREGDILAVNGPPGTGKTTLLQSVVANAVVEAAIKGDRPAVILACSTNNQAVTNIIDSFSNVKRKQGIQYERWLPDLNGFGLYLPSADKPVKDSIPHLKRIQGKLQGWHRDIESRDYLDRAEQRFKEAFASYSGTDNLSVQEIVDHLRIRLKENQGQLESGISNWQKYKGIAGLLDELDGGAGQQLFAEYILDDIQLNSIESALKHIEVQVNDYLESESFWTKLFSFLGFVKRKRAARLKQLFRECPIDISTIDFFRIQTASFFFDEKLELIKQIRQFDRRWKKWKVDNNIKGNPPLSDEEFKRNEQQKKPFFYDELETGLKYEQFHLAVHYWEGRWIMETKDIVDSDSASKNGLGQAKARWERFCMLTPCLVSTFYMAPKFFSYSKFIKSIGTKNVFGAPPLLDFIDLLIVDESGQVSPEIGAATFALAKQALVVGDIYQIEPVWSVPEKVDHANLARYKVTGSVNDRGDIEELLDKGFLSSSGSIMKLAQKASAYRLSKDAERGMLLTEHRRCYDEIIEYCNKLAYNNLLVARRGPARNALYPPMQFIESSGDSDMIGSSRGNRKEARIIAEWLSKNQQEMIHYYQQLENADSQKDGRPTRTIRLSDIVGIITPFTGQKFLLKNALKASSVDTSGLTIGTVHALQGAERPIVLFSSTYGANDRDKAYFFDSGVNMLNVAVSRAKDAFIFFGHSENFNRKGNAPSVRLFRYIKNL